MKYKLLTIALIGISFSTFSQTVPPDPEPGCDGVNAVGLLLPNGQYTQHFIGGYDIQNDNCFGVGINISYGQLNPGEYAYGTFDADLILETTPEMVDFSFDLTNTLTSLPVWQQVKIAELNSTNTQIADLTLRKLETIGAVSSKKDENSEKDPYKWQLTVRWYGTFNTIYTEESFVFTMNEIVEYNYIFDDSDPNSPVSMISFGGDDISVNPYNLPSGGLTTYSLGLIETSAPLYVGDEVIFDINWDIGTVTE